MHKTDPKLIPLESSFLSVERDMYLILKKLFEENPTVAEALKRLLVINNKRSVSKDGGKYIMTAANSKEVEKVLDMELPDLIDASYIRLIPKLPFPEHEEVRSYILISMDNFVPNAQNPQYRDCIVSFDILCHPEYWSLTNYKLRPLEIAGYIDAVLNNSKLTGIGTFQFLGCNELVLDENLSGYTLSYMAIHGSEDWLPDKSRRDIAADDGKIDADMYSDLAYQGLGV